MILTLNERSRMLQEFETTIVCVSLMDEEELCGEHIQ